MQGIEKSHCEAVLTAILNAAYDFWRSTVESALRPISKYGKSDTLGMDAIPEITIIKTLQEYDEQSIVITEETGFKEIIHISNSDDQNYFRTVFISDPTDRSSQIKKSLEAIADKKQIVSKAMESPEFKESWGKNFGQPLDITGGTSAITCVRRGIPIFSVIINYVTRKLFLACSAGCYSLTIGENQTAVNLDLILTKGEQMFFNNIDSNDYMTKFVTFMGKSGYKENFIDSQFMTEEDMVKNLHYNLPGGPSRVLYLSDLQDEKIGFVLANGEKITEWIHWLPYLRFARKKHDQSETALRLFEIYQDRPWTKEGILMSTPPAYSIFKTVSDDNKMVININRFKSFLNPSQVRSTLILTSADNIWATRVVNQYGYRQIEF
ncbi:MAG: hypothetical protein WC456_04100 [Patescibacteria group bacterium]